MGASRCALPARSFSSIPALPRKVNIEADCTVALWWTAWREQSNASPSFARNPVPATSPCMVASVAALRTLLGSLAGAGGRDSDRACRRLRSPLLFDKASFTILEIPDPLLKFHAAPGPPPRFPGRTALHAPSIAGDP